MSTRRRFLIGAAGVLAAAAVTGGWCVRRDVARADARITALAPRRAETPFGPIEYASSGEGPPVLMLHGSGGGFDQGLAFARPLLEAGWQVIAPSRFGYLGTPLPEDAGHRAQADALAALLDHLGLDKLPVIGASAGAVSAASLAERHPERCAALVLLVPAIPLPGAPPMAPWGPWQERLAMAALSSNALYAALRHFAPGFLTRTLLATDPELVIAATVEERRRVARILEEIQPISRRASGILNDGRETRSPEPPAYAEIRIPTLAISFEDDRYETDDLARAAAALIPGAETIILPVGGHVGVGRYDEAFAAIDRFLRSPV